jgi:hypothetical protein
VRERIRLTLSPARALSGGRGGGRGGGERIQELTYLELQTMDDDHHRHGLLRRYWKGHYLRQFGGEAIDAFLSRGGAMAMPGCCRLAASRAMVAPSPRWATTRPRPATATRWSSSSPWPAGPTRPRTRRGWQRRGATAPRSSRSPAAPTSTTLPTRGGRHPACLQPGQAGRLAALKDRHDPDNVFHLNHNIHSRKR